MPFAAATALPPIVSHDYCRLPADAGCHAIAAPSLAAIQYA